MSASPEDHAAARNWLREHAHPSMDDLLDAVQQIYGDGTVIGAASAAQQTGHVTSALTDLLPGAATGDVDWQAFWDAWTPGDSDAAALLNNGGLADLLDNADVTIRGIVGTTLDRLGNALADGAASGESVDTIADSLADIVSDPDRAYRIANTELNRAVTQASLDGYGLSGVGRWELVTSPDACDDCTDIADGGPYPVEDSDDQPPIHPGCRCSVSPVTGGADAPAEDAAAE